MSLQEAREACRLHPSFISPLPSPLPTPSSSSLIPPPPGSLLSPPSSLPRHTPRSPLPRPPLVHFLSLRICLLWILRVDKLAQSVATAASFTERDALKAHPHCGRTLLPFVPLEFVHVVCPASVGGHLNCFHFYYEQSYCAHSYACSLWTRVFNPLGMNQEWHAGSEDYSMFHLLGNCQMTFPHTCAFSHSQGEASKLSTPWTMPATIRLLGPGQPRGQEVDPRVTAVHSLRTKLGLPRWSSG